MNKIELGSLLRFILKYVGEIISLKNSFITRAPKLGLLPIIFKKLFRHKIIIRMGCTPFVFIERQAFFKNVDFKPKISFFKKIFYFVEPYIELYAVKNADGFIIENERARKIAILCGVAPEKIKLIPYYVEEYFTKV